MDKAFIVSMSILASYLLFHIDKIDEVLDQVRMIYSRLLSTIVSNLTSIIEGPIYIISQIFTGLGDLASSFIEAITTIIDNIFSATAIIGIISALSNCLL